MTAGTVRAALGRDVDVRRELPRVAAYLALWGLGIAVVASSLAERKFGTDALAYWIAWHRPSLYSAAPAARDAFLYSPAFAELVRPLAWLPFPLFATLIGAANLALMVWLLRPLGWRWVLPLLLFAAPEIIIGNVFIPMAVACVLGFRYPAAWAFPLLTKITPGLGPLWFLVRREWRPLAVSLAATAAVVAVSAAINPSLWIEWVRFLTAHQSQAAHPAHAAWFLGLAYRLPVGVALVAWGAWRGKRWTLPVGMVLCTPVLWYGAVTLLAAIPRSSGEGGPVHALLGARQGEAVDGECSSQATATSTHK